MGSPKKKTNTDTPNAYVIQQSAVIVSVNIKTRRAGKDLATHKATYPKLIGIEKAKEFADGLVMKAKELSSSKPTCKINRPVPKIIVDN